MVIIITDEQIPCSYCGMALKPREVTRQINEMITWHISVLKAYDEIHSGRSQCACDECDQKLATFGPRSQ